MFLFGHLKSNVDLHRVNGCPSPSDPTIHRYKTYCMWDVIVAHDINRVLGERGYSQMANGKGWPAAERCRPIAKGV